MRATAGKWSRASVVLIWGQCERQQLNSVGQQYFGNFPTRFPSFLLKFSNRLTIRSPCGSTKRVRPEDNLLQIADVIDLFEGRPIEWSQNHFLRCRQPLGKQCRSFFLPSRRALSMALGTERRGWCAVGLRDLRRSFRLGYF